MIVFRRAQLSDLDAIHHLAMNSGCGITTLPKNKDVLKKRLAWSCESFTQTINKPCNEYYLFILQDTETHQVLGTSAIEASTGYETPFYSYKLSKRTRICHSQAIRSDYELLSLVNDYQGVSELCTLFLDPLFRKNNNGLLLSKARFLFIAQHPKRFTKTVIAEMRGISDEWGHSPFWDNVGKHFFHMPFIDADGLTLSTNKQFIADLMPTNPLYVKLLAPVAQAVIGKPHQTTMPAMNILLNEGFRYNNYVDIFDAGPTIEAVCQQIRTIKMNRLLTASLRQEPSPSNHPDDTIVNQHFLIANTQLDFRAVIAPVINTDEHCMLSNDIAKALNIKSGDKVRISPLFTPASLT